MDAIGRDRELASLTDYLDAPSRGASAFVLTGPRGIGKTSVWQAGVQTACDRGHRVLTCRADRERSGEPFAGLAELVLDVPSLLAPMAGSHRDAFESTLSGAPDQEPLDSRAAALAVLLLLRRAAAASPVLIAVDDAHLLDPESAAALEFAVGRVAHQPIRLLLTVPEDSLPAAHERLDRLLAERAAWLRLGPLDLAATLEMLGNRFPRRLPAALVERIHRQCRGVPLLEIETARLVQDRHPRGHEPLPMPALVRDLALRALAPLPEATTLALLTAAAMDIPWTATILEAIRPDDPTGEGLADAVARGLLREDGNRMEFPDPVVPWGVYVEAGAEARRRIHCRLAEIAPGKVERALHRARGVLGPDGEAAVTLEVAARRALAEGSPGRAADCLELAERLTDPGDVFHLAWRKRRAAEVHLMMGDSIRAREHLAEALDLPIVGATRAMLLWSLAAVGWHQDRAAAGDLLRSALAVHGLGETIRAGLIADLAWVCASSGEVRAGAEHAVEALRLAERVGEPEALAPAVVAQARVDMLRGEPVRLDALSRAKAFGVRSGPLRIVYGASLMYAAVLKDAGDLEGARGELVDLYVSDLESGDRSRLPYLLYEMCDVECRAGNFERAESYAREGQEVSLRSHQSPLRALAALASGLVATYKGEEEEARRHLDEAERLTASSAVLEGRSSLREVRILLELSLGNIPAALAVLDPPASHGAGAGVSATAEGDVVEVLILGGRLDEAEVRLERFERRARATASAPALATVSRCRGILAAATGDVRAAVPLLEEAVAKARNLGQPFELGRSLLAAGSVQVRARQRSAARRALNEAVRIFEALGTTLWKEKVTAELGRISGRVPNRESLSPAEHRVVKLVLTGASNREVAEALFISPKTVDSHLSSIYRKLRVHRRTELFHVLTSQAAVVVSPQTGQSLKDREVS